MPLHDGPRHPARRRELAGPRARALAAALAGAGVLVVGCAATVGGTADVDPSALLSAGTHPTGASSAPTSNRLPTSLSFNLPVPPTPTFSSSTPPTTPPSSGSIDVTPTRDTSAGPTTATSGPGVDIDAIIAQLAAHSLVADAAATKAADPTALAALDKQIAAARTAGFPLNVVLIGHEVDDLTTITDAIANRTDTTTIAVSPSHFAVSSKDFTTAQLNKAEQSASQASDPVEAASKLITSLQAQRRPGTSSTKATTTKATAQSTARSTASSTAAGGVLNWDRFQLPDGSIACMIASNSVRCDVLQHTYTPPKNPNPNCEGDYGAAVLMTAKGAPTFICISDTVADPSLPKLANGATTQVGDVMCFSDPPSITCLNVASVHGFLIQPDTYQFY
jgi:hypothetical protein